MFPRASFALTFSFGRAASVACRLANARAHWIAVMEILWSHAKNGRDSLSLGPFQRVCSDRRFNTARRQGLFSVRAAALNVPRRLADWRARWISVLEAARSSEQHFRGRFTGCPILVSKGVSNPRKRCGDGNFAQQSQKREAGEQHLFRVGC